MAGGRKRGPKPKPMALKRLGSRGSRSPNKDKLHPAPRVEIPDVPESIKFDKVAATLWTKLTTELKRMRIIARDDSVALEGLCIAYSRAQLADEEVRLYGLTTESQFGRKANPSVYISRSSWSDVRKFAAEFGLTPSGRRNVFEVPADADPEVKEQSKGKVTAERFLFGGAVAGKISRAG